MNRTHILALAAALLTLTLVAFPGSVRPSAASAPTLRLVAPTDDLPALAPVTVELHALEATDLAAWELTLTYDPSFLTLADMEAAPGLGNDQADCDPSGKRCVLLLGPRPTLGGVSLGAVSYGRASGLDGEGAIALLHFQPTGRTGTTTIGLTDGLVTDRQGQAVTPLLESTDLTLGAGGHRLYLPSIRNNP